MSFTWVPEQFMLLWYYCMLIVFLVASVLALTIALRPQVVPWKTFFEARAYYRKEAQKKLGRSI